jgi:hypothetical protein
MQLHVKKDLKARESLEPIRTNCSLDLFTLDCSSTQQHSAGFIENSIGPRPPKTGPAQSHKYSIQLTLEQTNIKIREWTNGELDLIFIVLVHWTNSQRVDRSRLLDTISRCRGSQPLRIFLKAVCLAEK